MLGIVAVPHIQKKNSPGSCHSKCHLNSYGYKVGYDTRTGQKNRKISITHVLIYTINQETETRPMGTVFPTTL